MHLEDKYMEKIYYVLKDAKKTLVSFIQNGNEALNIEEFTEGNWMKADYETKGIVEKAVKFGVINNPSVATKITSQDQLDKLIVEKIRKNLCSVEKN